MSSIRAMKTYAITRVGQTECVNENTFQILSNAANLARFALRMGGWPRRSGPRGVDVLPQNPFTLSVTLCMRAKDKNDFRFIAYSTFSVQR